MLKTELIWGSTPLIYNDQKYSYKILENDHIRFFEKEKNTTIFNIYSPIFMKEIFPDEFIIVYPATKNFDYQFILQHIKENKVIYEKQYTSKKAIGEITEFHNIYIMEGFLETTLYNTITNQSLTLENTEIKELTNKELKNKYLQGTMDVQEKDELTMYIDISTLEFNGFYSELQDRFIPIMKTKDKSFLNNVNLTIQKEVLKYINLLEKYKNLYHEQRTKKATQILTKNLNYKK